jgi:hypothetical protein
MGWQGAVFGPADALEQMMMILRLALIALLLPAPLAAEEPSARFVMLMSHLPDSVMANGARAMPEFVDFDAGRDVVNAMVAAGISDVAPDTLRSFAGPLSEMPMGTDWTARVGFARGDVVAAAGTGSPEERGMVLQLSPGVMPHVGPALLTNGYAIRQSGGAPAYWRGVDDHGIDVAYRSPDDPFAFPLPLSTRVTLDGDLIFQSVSWPVLEAMVARKEASAVLNTFGAVIDAPDWGARQLLHATVFCDPMAFALPVRVIDAEKRLVAYPLGVPYWSNLMIADLSDGANDLSLIVLIYTARSDAEVAAATMQDALPTMAMNSYGGDKTLGDLIGRGRSTVIGDGPYAAVYAVETALKIISPRQIENHGYTVLMQAVITRDLRLLGPSLR